MHKAHFHTSLRLDVMDACRYCVGVGYLIEMGRGIEELGIRWVCNTYLLAKKAVRAGLGRNDLVR